MSVSGRVDEAVCGEYDLDQLKEAFKHGVGAASRLGLQRTPRDTALIYHRIQWFLIEHTRLGIPACAIDEVLHGLVAQSSTTFPQDRYRPYDWKWRPESGSFWRDFLLMVKWQALWGCPQIQAADARVSPLATAAFVWHPELTD